LVVFRLPLWKMMEFVKWDDDIPNWMENFLKFHGSSHHQPVMVTRSPCELEDMTIPFH
jgi:hypothetical protein